MKKRFRLMYKFWLDVNKPDEFELAEQIDELKAEHTFTKTIRDGLRLIQSLRQGRVDVLLEMFPFVEAELQPRLDVPDNSVLYEEIGGLRQLIADRLAATNGANMPHKVGELVGETVPDLADLPSMFVATGEVENPGTTRENFSSGLGDLFGDDDDDFDDDEAELMVRKDTSTVSTQKIVTSMMSLQQ